jgi:hypothetical protein
MAEATKGSGGQKSQKSSSGSASKKGTGSTRPRAPRAEPSRRLSGARIAERAGQQLSDLAGKEVEGVTALRRAEDSWEVEVETVELRRIPSTTDVLATYLVTLDSSGELEEYRRLRRYVRGQVEEGS